jgi:hypothetical protein
MTSENTENLIKKELKKLEKEVFFKFIFLKKKN